MKSQLIFLKLAWLLTISLFGGGVNAALPVPEQICSGKNDSAPVFLHRGRDGSLQTLEVFADRSGAYSGKYTTLSPEAITKICANGVSLSVLPVVSVPTSAADGAKSR